MKRLEEPKRVEARLAWALIWMAVIVFLFALVWGMLNPHFFTLKEQANTASGDGSHAAEAAETGLSRVSWLWKLAPFWVGMGVLLYGYRRSINESKRNPGG